MTTEKRMGPKYKIHPDQYKDIINSSLSIRLLARKYNVIENTIRVIIRTRNKKVA